MISKNDIKELILKNLEENHFLIDISVSVNNQIQVFIDSKEGLPIKECISYSRLIENHFDREVEDYELSVSSGGLDLPFTGLSVEADLSKVSFRGNSISDIKAGIVYESSFGLGATLGLRKENLVIDDIDGTYGTIDIEGVYAGLFYHF
jgi:hypothetical protein